jgi:hypothetical protein
MSDALLRPPPNLLPRTNSHPPQHALCCSLYASFTCILHTGFVIPLRRARCPGSPPTKHTLTVICVLVLYWCACHEASRRASVQ